MQVRNKLTGATTHVKNNDTTIQALLKLGVLEVVANDPGDWIKTPNGAVVPMMAPPPAPKWSVALVGATKPDKVGELGDTTRIPAIVFEIGNTVYERYVGPPKDIKKAWGKRAVPAEIWQQYSKLYKEHYRGN